MRIHGREVCQAFQGIARTRLAAAGLIGLFALQAITSINQKCTTYDEIAHLTGGYSYWQQNDYRLYPENGNLSQRWVALPLLFGDYRLPPLNQPAWWHSRVYDLGHQFFYEVKNDPAEMLWRSRMMIVLLGVALGWLIYEWSRRLFGPEGGIVSLGIFAFSPTMLAHSRLATSDIAVSLMFTTTLACVWMTMHRISPHRLLISGLAMGLLAVAKFSAILIGPVTLILMAIRLKGGAPLLITFGSRKWLICSRGRQFALVSLSILGHIAIVILVIWAFYGFRYDTFSNAMPGRDTTEFGETIDSLVADSPYQSAITLFRDHQLLPETYLYALAFVLRDERATIQIAFLDGQYSYDGWWYFFPYCTLVKTPLAVFALLALSALAAGSQWARSWRGGRHRSRAVWRRMRGMYRTAPLWVFLIVYWILAMQQNVNFGERHIVPTYPMTYILAGAAGRWICSRHRVLCALVMIALCQLSIEALAIRPHYLAYFNQLVGGPKHGYRHLVDCSLDWGQDLPGLKRWLDQHGSSGHSGAPVYLWYFGAGSPQHYGIEHHELHSKPTAGREFGDLRRLTAGVYCISATVLQSLYGVGVGPWAVPHERQYQRAKQEVEILIERYGNRDHRAEPTVEERSSWPTLATRFEQLRSARLCAYLRQREPDAAVGYSILIYRLTDQDIRRALDGPPVELQPRLGVER